MINKSQKTSESPQKYKTPNYVIVSKLQIYKSLEKDDFSKSQQSGNLSARSVRLFLVKVLIKKDDV